MSRIVDLPELTAADDADILVIEDVSAGNTKKVTRGNLVKNIDTAQIEDGAVTIPKISNPYKFSAYLGANQNITSAGVWTKITLNTELFDSNNNFDSTTNYRYVAPINGFYQIDTVVTSTTTGASSTITMTAALYKNGSLLRHGDAQQGSGNANTITRHLMCGLFQLTAGDYLEAYVYMGETGRAALSGAAHTAMTGFLVSVT